jgi:hypothetical protein
MNLQQRSTCRKSHLVEFSLRTIRTSASLSSKACKARLSHCGLSESAHIMSRIMFCPGNCNINRNTINRTCTQEAARVEYWIQGFKVVWIWIFTENMNIWDRNKPWGYWEIWMLRIKIFGRKLEWIFSPHTQLYNTPTFCCSCRTMTLL